jgi:hypothetical protein
MVGKPGLGKSHLIEEFHARLREVPHTWAEWNCSQLLQNTPLHPVTQWGRQRFGGADVPAEQRLADLESSLEQIKLDPASPPGWCAKSRLWGSRGTRRPTFPRKRALGKVSVAYGKAPSSRLGIGAIGAARRSCSAPLQSP